MIEKLHLRRRELGERLRHARKKAKKTQLDVADELHISRAVVAHWETGRSEPSALQVIDLCAAYGTPTDTLLLGLAVVHLDKLDLIEPGACDYLDKAREQYGATYSALARKGHDSGMMGLP